MSNNYTQFIVRKGVPEVLACFWNYTPKPTFREILRGMNVPVMGDKDLYTHIRLKDFFICEVETSDSDENATNKEKEVNKGIRTIHSETKIIVDLFIIPQSDYDEVYNINDLAEVKNHVKQKVLPAGEIVIDLSNVKDVQDVSKITAKSLSVKTTFGDNSTEEIHSDVELYLTKTGGSGAISVYDMAVKVPFTNEQLEYLSSKNENEDSKGNFITKDDVKIISWAWINNTSTQKQYSDIFGIDLNNTENRQDFLINPFDKKAVKKDGDTVKRKNIPDAVSKLSGAVKSIWNSFNLPKEIDEKVESTASALVKSSVGEVKESRNEYDKTPELEGEDSTPVKDIEDLSPDFFPFDEPFVNFLFFRRKSAFKKVSLGMQLGEIGLISQSSKNIDLIGNVAFKNYDPAFHKEHNTLELGSEEITLRGENRFFFQPESFPHWLNSIEEKFSDRKDFGNGFPIKTQVVSKEDFPFKKNQDTLTGKFHDFLPDYNNGSSRLETYSDGKTRYHYNGYDFETICVSEGSIINRHYKDWPDKNSKDKIVGIMGKGFPTKNGVGRFMGSASTIVNLKAGENPNWQKWRAFSIAHKPIMLYYELDRDLSESEISAYLDDPLTLYMDCFYEYNNARNYVYKINFDISKSSKKGKHLVLMYPAFHSDNYWLEKCERCFVSLGKGNSLLKLQNYQSHSSTYNNGWKRKIKVSAIKSLESFTTYTPRKDGLFQDNPIITVEDFIPKKVKDNIAKNSLEDYKFEVAKESVKFLTSLVPGWGDALSAASDIGFSFVKDLKWKGKSNLELGSKVLNCFMDDYLQLKKGAPFEVNSFKEQFGEDWKKIKPCVGAAVGAVSLIAAISKAKADLSEKMLLTFNPFLRGQKFGESQSIFDSVYLIAVSEKQRAIENGKFVYKETNESAMFFFNRKVDFLATDVGFEAYNHQFAPTGGFLERDDSNINDDEPLGGYKTDFINKLSNFKKAFSKELSQISPDKKETTSGDFVKLLKKKDIFQKIFKNSYANPKIVEFMGKDEIPRLVDKFIVGKKSFTDDDDSVKMQTFSLILNYMNTLFPSCPACGQPVSLSWGWCPNHATSVDLGELGVKDKDDFITLLLEADKKIDGQGLEKDPTLISILESLLEKNNNRLLVHWTEFDILK